MQDNNLPFLERFDKQRRRAMDMDFNVVVERAHIEVTPGLLKAMDQKDRVPMRLHSVEELEKFLDGINWQRRYAQSLGFEEKAAERGWWEEKDRRRILETLSRD